MSSYIHGLPFILCCCLFLIFFPTPSSSCYIPNTTWSFLYRVSSFKPLYFLSAKPLNHPLSLLSIAFGAIPHILEGWLMMYHNPEKKKQKAGYSIFVCDFLFNVFQPCREKEREEERKGEIWVDCLHGLHIVWSFFVLRPSSVYIPALWTAQTTLFK